MARNRQIVNLGSLCFDNVYQVENFVQPGETISSLDFYQTPGGKGLNQSIALGKAGSYVLHAGLIGDNSEALLNVLKEAHVSTDLITVLPGMQSGHAIIQVNEAGENSIILFAGTNHEITLDYIEKVLAVTQPGDYLVLQNEINYLPEIIAQAAEKQCQIIFNAAPYHPHVNDYPLEKLAYLIINEIEGEGLAKTSHIEEMLTRLTTRYPNVKIIVTLGDKGAAYAYQEERFYVKAPKVKVVDSTAAGDTFVGYFIHFIANDMDINSALTKACAAASLSVTKPGSARSIPNADEVALVLNHDD